MSKARKRRSRKETGSTPTKVPAQEGRPGTAGSADASGPWKLLCRGLFGATLLYCAAAINFNPLIQSFHQADTLLRALISTVRWTPFYWTENRLGSLTPLLAMGIHNPLPNLLFQTQIHVLACLLCVWLIVALCAGAGRAFSTEVLLTTQVLWLLSAAVLRINSQSVPSFFLGETSALSMALVLGALVLALHGMKGPEAVRHALVVALSFLAFWLYIPHVAFALSVLMVFPGGRANFRSRAMAVLDVLLAFVAVYLWERLSPGPNFHGLAGIRQIPHAIAQLWWTGSTFVIHVQRLFWIAAGGIALAGIRFGVRRTAPLRVAALLAGAMVLLGMVVVSAWVRDNAYFARFLTSPTLLIIPIACYPLARSLASLAGTGRAYACVAVSAVCIAAASIALGFPSPARAEEAVDRVTAFGATDIAALGCTHLTGDYWQVWPGVFHHNAHPSGTPLWGVTLRASATRDLWDAPPPTARAYCSVCEDTHADSMRRLFHLGEFLPNGRSGDICRYRVGP